MIAKRQKIIDERDKSQRKYKDLEYRKSFGYERDEDLRQNDEARKLKLKDSCKPSKVRTYACDTDGMRVIKYFSYHYDFDQDQCVE